MPPLYREFTSQQQIDEQYDALRRVADPAALNRRYVERSQFAREQLRCSLDVPYGQTLDETLDIFPSEKPLSPVFVFLHGGYWRARSSKEFSLVGLGLQKLGITTVVVNYSLCPKVSLDEITRQCRASVAWVLRHIQAHHGDPKRVVLGGHSAGGHLTAMCLQTRWAEDYGLSVDPLAGALLISGLYDLEPFRFSYLQPMLQLDDGVIRRNSPAFSVRRCATPVWVTWGSAESEEFARQSTLFHEAWAAAGNRSELRALPGADHFTGIEGFEDQNSELCRWIQTAAG